MTGLEELVNLPNIYFGTSFITDIVATYIAVKKKGTRVEGHKKFKDLMKKHGPHSLFTRILPLQAVIGGAILGIGYAVDRGFGIDDLRL